MARWPCVWAIAIVVGGDLAASQAQEPANAKAKPATLREQVLSVSGIALGPDDKPVSGAKIFLAATRFSPERLLGETTTDERGRYEFRDVKLATRKLLDRDAPECGTFQVFGIADGNAFAWSHLKTLWVGELKRLGRQELLLQNSFRVGDPIEIELRFSSRQPIVGRIVDEQGKGVPGVEVRLVQCDMLDAPDASQRAIEEFSALALARQRLPATFLSKSGPEGDFEFTAVPANAICILDFAHPKFRHAPIYTATTEQPPVPEYEGQKVWPLPIELTLSTDVAPTDVKSVAATPPEGFRTMTVRTVDDAGKPVPQTRIFVNATNPQGTSNRNYESNEHGEVEVLVPDSPRLCRVWTWRDGYVPMFIQWWPGYQEDGHVLPRRFTCRMPRGTRIGGKVINDAGQPIEGAIVEVMLSNRFDQMGERPVPSTWLAENSEPGKNPSITDAEGRWTINNVPKGDEVLVAVKLTHRNYVCDTNWGSLQRDQNVTMEALRDGTATIQMHDGAILRGTITDPEGKPVAGAVVIWGDDPYLQEGSQEVRTDAKGRYEFPPLTAGNTTLTIVAKGWRPELDVVDVQPKMPDVDVRLQRGKKLRVKLVDAAGKPVPKAYVGLRGWRGAKSLYNHRHPNVIDTKIPIRANKEGVYEWNWAPDDAVTYSFSGPRGGDIEVTVTADGTEQLVTLPE